jgi:hypothetical protein
MDGASPRGKDLVKAENLTGQMAIFFVISLILVIPSVTDR